jgi:anti-sigma B factor antagonist
LLLLQEGTAMFSVDLSTTERGGLTVAVLRGELDVADAASVAAALAAAAEGARMVIVDLAGLAFIDSSGVAALASAARRARLGGSNLLLAAAQQQVLRVLALTRLTGAFSIHAGVDEAASSQGQSQAAVPGAARPGLLPAA